MSTQQLSERKPAAQLHENNRQPISKIFTSKKILIYTPSKLSKFLIKLLVDDTIFLDKYLIKIICVFFLFGANTKTIDYGYSRHFQILLFTFDDFVKPISEKFTYGKISLDNVYYISDEIREAFEVIIRYFREVLTIYLENIKKDMDNNILNLNSNRNSKKHVALSLIKNGHIKQVEFAYNFIDYSKRKKQKKQNSIELVNKTLLIRPAIICYYYARYSDLFHVLAGDNFNFQMLKSLINKSFKYDCDFDKSNFSNFNRYYSNSNNNLNGVKNHRSAASQRNKTNKKPTKPKNFNFSLEAKTYNGGVEQTKVRRVRRRHNTIVNGFIVENNFQDVPPKS